MRTARHATKLSSPLPSTPPVAYQPFVLFPILCSSYRYSVYLVYSKTNHSMVYRKNNIFIFLFKPWFKVKNYDKIRLNLILPTILTQFQDHKTKTHIILEIHEPLTHPNQCHKLNDTNFHYAHNSKRLLLYIHTKSTKHSNLAMYTKYQRQ